MARTTVYGVEQATFRVNGNNQFLYFRTKADRDAYLENHGLCNSVRTVSMTEKNAEELFENTSAYFEYLETGIYPIIHWFD